MYEQIPTADLRPEHLPEPNADWAEIREFAVTFDGYDHARSLWPGDQDACPDLAGRVRRAMDAGGAKASEFTLDDLRAALFWWQRVVRWSWTEVPDEETLEHCRQLVECMRERL